MLKSRRNFIEGTYANYCAAAGTLKSPLQNTYLLDHLEACKFVELSLHVSVGAGHIDIDVGCMEVYLISKMERERGNNTRGY